MAHKIAKVKKPNPDADPPGEKLEYLWETAQVASQTKPESAMVFTYAGYDKLLEGLAPKSPDAALADGSADIKAKWDDLIKPHSPLTPEEAGTRGIAFEAAVNLGWVGLTAICTAIEAGALGQLETPGFMAPHTPIVAAGLDAAKAIRRAYIDASIVKGVQYKALHDHQPVIVDPPYLIDAYNMGLITGNLYAGNMRYHGYTPERSTIIARSQIRMPDLDTILELRRRGQLTDKGVVDWLKLLKIPEEVARPLSMLYYQFPEPYRLALAHSKGILSFEEYAGTMANFGLDKTWSNVYAEQNYMWPTFEQSVELFWRGVIDDKAFEFFMTRNGFKSESISALKNLRISIPPSADLVTMVVREAFDPKMVVAAPDVFAQYMAMRGFSKEWADRYWTAHFLPIGLGQAYDNLRRGYWTKDEFMYALHIADVHPMWREAIYNVAFLPPSIREMGYGYDVGVYTVEDIIRYRRWGGLSPEDAEKAGIAMVAYRTEAEREAVRREYLHLFALGRLDRTTFEKELQRLGTASPAISLWLERGELEAERIRKEPAMPEQRIVSSTEALFAFEHGLKSEDWTRSALDELLWTKDRVDLAIQRIKYEKEQARLKAEVEEYRVLSITMVRDLYKYGKISADEVPTYLMALNYSPEQADNLAEIMITEVAKEMQPKRLTEADVESLYDMRLIGMTDSDAINKVNELVRDEGVQSPTLALFQYYQQQRYSNGDSARLVLATGVKFAFSDLRAMYSKGWITADVLVSELIRLGLPKARASELAMTVVKAEQPARTAAEKDLTKAEIIKGWKVGILTTPEAIGMLQGIGYDSAEAEYVLAINAVVAKADPEGYWEMRAVVEASKKARGLPYVEVPPELITLERDLRIAKEKVQQLTAAKASEEEIGEAAVNVATLEAEMRRIITAKKLQ